MTNIISDNLFIEEIKAKAPNEKKRLKHPSQMWREQKIYSHITCNGLGVVAKLRVNNKRAKNKLDIIK